MKKDEIVEVLKNKFSVAQKNITALVPTQLMSVLAKKLVKHRYYNVKEGEIRNLKEDQGAKKVKFTAYPSGKL